MLYNKLYYNDRSVYDLLGEYWLPVVGHEGKYEVSNFARVKSLWDNFGRRRDFILSQFENRDGYLQISIGNSRKVRQMRVHRIVCSAFRENPEMKPFVNHKDRNRKNNLPANVEWSTELENNQHARKMGVTTMGRFVLKEHEVIEIFNSKQALKALANKYGVDESTISTIRTGKNWSKITGAKRTKINRKTVTEEIAKEIYSSNLKGVQLAKIYGITAVTVSEIKNGRTWSKSTGHYLLKGNKK